MIKNEILNLSVYDFLTFCYSDSGNGVHRFVGLVTTQQMASLTTNYWYGHWELIDDLGSRIFPSGRNSYYEGDFDSHIVILGIKDSIEIVLPEIISVEQYQVMLKVIYEIKQFEDECNYPNFGTNCDLLFKELTSKIANYSLGIEKEINQEIIVGTPLTDLIDLNDVKMKQKSI